MQYLLTEDELNDLREKATTLERETADKLQRLCTMVADNVAVEIPWRDDGTKAVWGCILTIPREHYCDCCPVREECPNPHKEWSK